MPTFKSILTIVFIVLGSILALWLITSNFEAYSSFGFALLLAGTATFLLYAIDTWVLHGWDTIEEIKKNNVAAGLALLAYAILVGSCIIAAFVVFK